MLMKTKKMSSRCFYLTDEECKQAQTDEALKQAKRFYLTDEECKWRQILCRTAGAKFLSN